jgi:transposase
MRTFVRMDAAARAAMAALNAGDSVKAVAARFGVSIWCIYDLRLGRTFKHLRRDGAGAAAPYQPP